MGKYKHNELSKQIIDFIEENYGDRAVDKVDVEGLADACLLGIEACIDDMMEAAKEQAERKRGRHHVV
jgi:hypothetical protein